MPRGDKSAYTEKQKRQAGHIEDSAKERGYSAERAEQMAWATVNKEWGGGAKSGSGHTPAKAAKSAVAKSAAKSRATGTTSVERGETKTMQAGADAKPAAKPKASAGKPIAKAAASSKSAAAKK